MKKPKPNHYINALIEQVRTYLVYEFDRTFEIEDSLVDTNIMFNDDWEDDENKYINYLSAENLDENQKIQHKLNLKYCDDAHTFYKNKIEQLRYYIKECDFLRKKLRKEQIDYNKYMYIEAHIRVALASVGLCLPNRYYECTRNNVERYSNNEVQSKH